MRDSPDKAREGRPVRSLTGPPESCPGRRQQGESEETSSPRGVTATGPVGAGWGLGERHALGTLRHPSKPGVWSPVAPCLGHVDQVTQDGHSGNRARDPPGPWIVFVTFLQT